MLRQNFEHQAFSIEEELPHSLNNCLGSTIDEKHITLLLVTINPDPKRVHPQPVDDVSMPYKEMSDINQMLLCKNLHKDLTQKFGLLHNEVHFEQAGYWIHTHSIVETKKPLTFAQIKQIQKYVHLRLGRGKKRHNIVCDVRGITDMRGVNQYVNKQNCYEAVLYTSSASSDSAGDAR